MAAARRKGSPLAPDDECAVALSFSVSSLGSVRTEILRAFSFEAMGEILDKMV
jgi:uncharacterized protein with GYD domain